MRVALVSEHTSPLVAISGINAGGQHVHVAELASGLVRLGHSVAVYTRRNNPHLTQWVTTSAGYEVIQVPAGPEAPISENDLWPYTAAFAERLSEVLSFQRPDVLHAHSWMSAVVSAHAATRLNLPLLVTFHTLGSAQLRYEGSSETSPHDRIQVETAMADAADCIVATHADAVRELALLGVPADKVAVVPRGVDLEHFSPAAGKNGSPAVPDRACRYRLVSAGRLTRRRGYDTTIEALAQLPETELLIAGGVAAKPEPEQDQLPEQDRLLALAERQGVGDRVQLVGPLARTHMPALLRSADLVVCAPWYESFGTVPLEAMACGVPVVATAVGGMLDTVVDGVTGVHVSPRDRTAALAAAIGALLQSPRRRAELARAGLVRVRSRYSWDRAAADTAAVYERTVWRRASRQASAERNLQRCDVVGGLAGSSAGIEQVQPGHPKRREGEKAMRLPRLGRPGCQGTRPRRR